MIDKLDSSFCPSKNDCRKSLSRSLSTKQQFQCHFELIINISFLGFKKGENIFDLLENPT